MQLKDWGYRTSSRHEEEGKWSGDRKGKGERRMEVREGSKEEIQCLEFV